MFGLQFTHISRPDVRTGGLTGYIQKFFASSPASLQILLFSLPPGADLNTLNHAYANQLNQMASQGGGMGSAMMQLMAQPRRQQPGTFGDLPGLVLDFEHSLFGLSKSIERRFLTLTHTPQGSLGAVLFTQSSPADFARWENDVWNIATSLRFGPAEATPQPQEIIDHTPPLRVPAVDGALGWAWLVDLGQGNYSAASEGAEEALRQRRNADTLFAQAVVHQLRGNFKDAFPLFEDAFNATTDPGRQFIIAAIARLAERRRADTLLDGFPIRLPEATQRFGDITQASQWEQRWGTLKEQVNAPYARLAGEYVHCMVKGTPGADSLSPFQDELVRLAQLSQQAEQLGARQISLLSIVSFLELAALTGQAALDYLNQQTEQFRQIGATSAVALLSLYQGDLLTSPAPLGHPILLGYRPSDSDTQVTVPADPSRFNRSSIDVAGARAAYTVARQYFVLDGADRGKAMVRLRLAYLDAVEAIANQDRAKWEAATQGYAKAKRRFSEVGDQVNVWAATMGELWTRLHLGEPRAQLVAEVKALAEELKANDALAWGLSWGLVLAYAGREALAMWADVDLALRAADLAEAVFDVFNTPRRQAQTCSDRAEALRMLEAVEESLAEAEAALGFLQKAIERSDVEALSCKAMGIQLTANLMEIYSGQFDANGIERTRDRARTFLEGVENVTAEEVEEAWLLAQMSPELAAQLQFMTEEEAEAKLEKIKTASFKINAFSLHQTVNGVLEQAAVWGPLSLGLEKLEAGSEEEAKLHFQAALKAAESRPDRNLQRGVIFTAWRKPEEALAALRQYLDDGLPQATDTLQSAMPAIAELFNPALAEKQSDVHQVRAREPLVELFIKNSAWTEAREQLAEIERLTGPLQPLGHVPTLDVIRNHFYHGLIAGGHKEYESALDHMRQAVDGLESRRRYLRRESLRRALGGQFTTVQVYADYAHLLAETGRWEDAFETADLIRARVLSESLAGACAVQRELGSNDAYRRYMEQQGIVERITAQLNLVRHRQADPPDPTREDKLEAELKAATEELDRREVALTEACPRWRELSAPQSETLSLADVSRELPPGVLLLAYLFHSEWLLGWAVTADGLVSHVSQDQFDGQPFITRPFTAQDGKWVDQLNESQEQPNLGQALARVLIEPFDDIIAQAEHLLIVPFAELNTFPFQALPWRGQELGWQKPVSYLPAASMLQQFHSSSPTASGALVVGDPEKMARFSLRTGRPERFSPLPSARIEARLVAELYDGARPLIGAEATEQALRAELGRDPRVIHLATHGYIEPGAPLASGIALALDKSLSDDELRELLSADQWAGTLSVDELMGLDLKADVVVLSACDTGRGDLQGSEVIGMARGLLYAGARTVVVSMWKASDICTPMLMQLFHLRLRAGQPPAKALCWAECMLSQVTAGQARRFYQEALDRQAGADVIEQGRLLWRLGDVMRLGGDHAQALVEYEQAMTVLNAQVDQEGHQTLEERLKEARFRSRRHGSFDSYKLIFRSARYWAAFEVIGDWRK